MALSFTPVQIPPVKTSMKKTLRINQTAIELDLEPDTPLLWVLRDEVGLDWNKVCCGIAQCDACTVHLMVILYDPVAFPFEAVPENSEITTIEALCEGWIACGAKSLAGVAGPPVWVLSIRTVDGCSSLASWQQTAH